MFDKHKLRLDDIMEEAHQRSRASGWWVDPITGVSLIPGETENLTEGEELLIKNWFPYVIGTKIALIHSEISEALEGYRSDKMDDKLTHRQMIEVELADAVIRICDLAEVLNLNVPAAIGEKFEVNAVRPDHKLDNRRKPGGKKF